MLDKDGRLTYPGIGALGAGLALETALLTLIRPANAASIRVAEKSGLQRTGTLQLFGQEALVYATN